MRTTADHANPLSRYLDAPPRVGRPAVAGALAVYPVFGAEPQLRYLALSQALAHGLVVTELEDIASVNDLTVHNATDEGVLLYEGEEVLGAQQNRTFDVSVLIAARSRLTVPVSCVEAGRWDASRHEEAFTAAPQAAHPDLRRAKARAVRARVAVGGEARAVQGEVWNAVAAKSARLGAHSPTGALHDVFERRRHQLGALQAAVPLHDGQVGSLVALGGRFAVLDLVSRPDVYAALHAPLVQGYGLDALEAQEEPAPSDADATDWLASLADAPLSERDGLGLGREVRFAQNGRAGSGLVAREELIQLSVFVDGDGHPRQPSTRIRRPWRRTGR